MDHSQSTTLDPEALAHRVADIVIARMQGNFTSPGANFQAGSPNNPDSNQTVTPESIVPRDQKDASDQRATNQRNPDQHAANQRADDPAHRAPTPKQTNAKGQPQVR